MGHAENVPWMGVGGAENCGPFQLPTPPGALSCLYVPYVASSAEGPFLSPSPHWYGHPDSLNSFVLGLSLKS